MGNPFIFNLRVYKNASFHKIVLKPKSWILILDDFNLFDIFIEFKWGVFPYLHLCFKVNRDWEGTAEGGNQVSELVIDYTGPVIDYKSLCMPTC